jgi:hypothetical protein
MRHSYRIASDGAYILEDGITTKAVFDKHGGACTFTLFGEMSEEKVIQVFDVLVPTTQRGSELLGDGVTYLGQPTLRSISYKNVDLVTGSVGKAVSDPAAIISFKRSNCKAAVAEARKQAFGWIK